LGHITIANVRIKSAKVKKGKDGEVRFEVSKLRDLETRNAFKLALRNRFKESAADGGGRTFGR